VPRRRQCSRVFGDPEAARTGSSGTRKRTGPDTAGMHEGTASAVRQDCEEAARRRRGHHPDGRLLVLVLLPPRVRAPPAGAPPSGPVHVGCATSVPRRHAREPRSYRAPFRFHPCHPRGNLYGSIGFRSGPYGRLSELLGRVLMLRASRREDRKRVPQYSSSQLPHGSAGADVRESSGKRRRGAGQAPGGPSAPGSRFRQAVCNPAGMFENKGHPCQWGRDTPDRVGRRKARKYRVPERKRDRTAE
jgi:hypothetical protein